MKNHNSCETIVVGQSKSCFVTQCPECDMFHLHIGPMTLRLKADVFENICETLIGVYHEQDKQVDHYHNRLHSH